MSFTPIDSNTKTIDGLANLMGEVIMEPIQQISDFIVINLTNKAMVNKNFSCSLIFQDENC